MLGEKLKELREARGLLQRQVAAKWSGTINLLARRTLENPVKITVRSFDRKTYPIDRDLEPMHSPHIRVVYDEAVNANTGEKLSNPLIIKQ